ncbi:MAG: hypothetical protein VYA84_14480 [Planctomycetota bacterium]|nr:hypothetical protein [Planctomycetota bacterium]
MLYRFMFALLLSVAALMPSTQAATLETLRQTYQEARDTVSSVQRPEIGSTGFQEKLETWADAQRESQESARALLPALLDHWMNPAGDNDVKEEIKEVFPHLAGDSQTEQYNTAKSFFARTAWPLLSKSDLDKDRAEFLAGMIQPTGLSSVSELLARFGRPTEPQGWDVQAAYALALIRSGKEKQARDQILMLHTKVSANYRANPEGGLDYGPEAGDARYRNYVDFLQLCEVLHALQASISDDQEGGKDRIKRARKLRDELSPEASILVAEIDL